MQGQSRTGSGLGVAGHGEVNGQSIDLRSAFNEPAAESTVAELIAGSVFSMPDSGLEPAVVIAISQDVAGSRFIDVIDLATGLEGDSRLSLGSQRQVMLHDDVEVEHHGYKNVSSEDVDVALGRRIERVKPGETVWYFGTAKPDVFDDRFEHTTEHFERASEQRPL